LGVTLTRIRENWLKLFEKIGLWIQNPLLGTQGLK